MAVVQLTTTLSSSINGDHRDYEEVLPEDNDKSVPMNLTVSAEKKKRKPKRILHFSDGILEEYSDEEPEPTITTDKSPLVDPRTLSWTNWAWYYVAASGLKTLAVCDYMGESLAWFFGITAPKYQYEIDEAERMQKEKETERAEQEVEMAGWLQRDNPVVTKQGEAAPYPQMLQVHTQPLQLDGKPTDSSHVVVTLPP